jgi:hypothetical protein
MEFLNEHFGLAGIGKITRLRTRLERRLVVGTQNCLPIESSGAHWVHDNCDMVALPVKDTGYLHFPQNTESLPMPMCSDFPRRHDPKFLSIQE